MILSYKPFSTRKEESFQSYDFQRHPIIMIDENSLQFVKSIMSVLKVHKTKLVKLIHFQSIN